MKLKFFYLIILVSLFFSSNTADPTDFEIYPEDTSILSDYIFARKTGEIFYGAYYFGNTITNILDYKNGLSLASYSDVS